MSDVEDPSYVGYTDEIHAKLDSIEHALVELGEELLLNERTEAEYAFAVHVTHSTRCLCRFVCAVGIGSGLGVPAARQSLGSNAFAHRKRWSSIRLALR